MEAYVHSSSCSGCPLCQTEMAAVLRASSQEYARWLTARTCADPSMRGAHVRRVTPGGRLNVQAEETVPPPPSLAAAIKKVRAASTGTPLPAREVGLPGLEVVSDGSVNAHGIPNPPKLVARR